VTTEKIWRYLSGCTDPLRTVHGPAFRECAGKSAIPGLGDFRKPSARSATQAASAAGADRQHPKKRLSRAPPGTVPDAHPRGRPAPAGKLLFPFSSLDAFLSELALLTGITEEGDQEEIAEDRVVLSSIHQAKGLEWMASS